jgi:hypothetical protein
VGNGFRIKSPTLNHPQLQLSPLGGIHKSNSFFDPKQLATMPDNDEDISPLLGDRHPSDYGAIDGAPAPAEPRTSFKRNLGTAEAFSIIISIVIGSGIFTSPGSIDTNVPSPGFALIVWLVGGILAWTGAATMAELGTAIPGEGTSLPSLLTASKLTVV